MKIAAARLCPYDLPLVRPWFAASAVLRQRRGLLLAVTTEEGWTGWGDGAPLPSSGEDGHAAVFAALRAAADGLPGQMVGDCLAGLAGEDAALSLPCPEARWALETALLDLSARQQGLRLACLLAAGALAAVPVNAALGALDRGCVERAGRALAGGFQVAKVKLGVYDVDGEVAALRALVARTGGRLRLRLDANRAWSVADALRALDAITDLPIDGIEEPLAAPTVAELARLQARYDFAIAVDESLPRLGAAALLAGPAVRRLVVKPARLGGVSATLRLAALARAAGVELVVTSVVDSAIGVTAAAQLAAALPGGAVHGLGTLDWLAADVAPAPLLVGGSLVLPAGSGLGLVPFGEAAQG